jgi:hypothetical protein
VTLLALLFHKDSMTVGTEESLVFRTVAGVA